MTTGDGDVNVTVVLSGHGSSKKVVWKFLQLLAGGGAHKFSQLHLMISASGKILQLFKVLNSRQGSIGQSGQSEGSKANSKNATVGAETYVGLQRLGLLTESQQMNLSGPLVTQRKFAGSF